VILHADRGLPVPSRRLEGFAREHNPVRSAGRRVVCRTTLRPNHSRPQGKSGSTTATKAAAKFAVGDWIERVYNPRRRHSPIGAISPVDSLRRHKPPDHVPTKRGHQTQAGDVHRIGTFTGNRSYNLASPGPAAGSPDRRLASRQRKADALADPKETEIHRHQDGFGGVCAAASVRSADRALAYLGLKTSNSNKAGRVSQEKP
jgi:hypothetical protein